MQLNTIEPGTDCTIIKNKENPSKVGVPKRDREPLRGTPEHPNVGAFLALVPVVGSGGHRVL